MKSLVFKPTFAAIAAVALTLLLSTELKANDDEFLLDEIEEFQSPQPPIVFQNETFYIKDTVNNEIEDMKMLFFEKENLRKFSKRIMIHKIKNTTDVNGFVQDMKNFMNEMKKNNSEARLFTYTAKDQTTKCIELVYEYRNYNQYDLIKLYAEGESLRVVKHTVREYKEDVPEKTFEQFKTENMNGRPQLWNALYTSRVLN